MAKFDTEKLNALKDLDNQYTCKHLITEIRKRTIKGGSIQYVAQCLECGCSRGKAISHQNAVSELNGKEPDNFDTNIEKERNAQREIKSKNIIDKFKTRDELRKNEFNEWYADYLQSAEWKIKKERVLKRAGGLCEGCLEAKADVVHHSTYDHVGNEFMFELIALCSPCHNRFHASTKRN